MDVQTPLEVSRVSRGELIEYGHCKGQTNVIMHCTFEKINPTGKADDENERYFHSEN